MLLIRQFSLEELEASSRSSSSLSSILLRWSLVLSWLGFALVLTLVAKLLMFGEEIKVLDANLKLMNDLVDDLIRYLLNKFLLMKNEDDQIVLPLPKSKSLNDLLVVHVINDVHT